MKVLFFIGSLRVGGAERQIINLVSGMRERGDRPLLVTFAPDPASGLSIEPPANVTRIVLNRARSRFFPGRLVQYLVGIVRLRRLIKRRKPKIVYSMLHGNNFIAWCASRGLRCSSLVWGLRASNMKLNWKRRLPERICAMVSSTLPLIITNSESGMNYFSRHGYCPRAMIAIPNGIDTQTFKPDSVLRSRVRRNLGIAEPDPLVTLVGRLDRVKNHRGFIEAAGLCLERNPSLRFLCVGNGPGTYRDEVEQWAHEAGIASNLQILTDVDDMPGLYNASDVVVSASHSEGFSNVLAEAMSCGTRCVATNVGDSERIVGTHGWMVTLGDSHHLSDAILDASAFRGGSCVECRDRIHRFYSVERTVDETRAALAHVASSLSAPAAHRRPPGC